MENLGNHRTTMENLRKTLENLRGNFGNPENKNIGQTKETEEFVFAEEDYLVYPPHPINSLQ